MNRKVPFALGEYYHLHNRGVEKRMIFMDDRDRNRFISLLYLCNTSKPIIWREVSNIWQFERGETLLDLGAYCLMPNHFHLLAKESSEGGISRFMQKVQTAYSMYFNRKYKRFGPLLQGKFRSHHVSEDSHLEYLYCYINLNPVEIKNISVLGSEEKLLAQKQFLKTYPYSSYPDYSNLSQLRPERGILNPSSFPDYFNTGQDFNDFINDWLEIRNQNEGNT